MNKMNLKKKGRETSDQMPYPPDSAQSQRRPPHSKLFGGDIQRGGVPAAVGHAGRARVALLLVALIVLSQVLCLSLRTPTTAGAASSESVTLDASGIKPYSVSDMSTGDNHSNTFCDTDGNVLYCLDAPFATPSAGTYAASGSGGLILDYILYYGYGGAGYCGSVQGYEGEHAQAITQIAVWYAADWNISDRELSDEGKSFFQEAQEKADPTAAYAGTSYIYGTDPGRDWQTSSSAQRLVGSVFPTVSVTFSKTSADLTLTKGNSEYSLGGAEYEIYRIESNQDVYVTTIVTDAEGHASYQLAANSEYYAVETKAPQGFQLNTTRVEFSTSSNDGVVELSDTPAHFKLSLQKVDAASGSEAQPSLSLAGATYKLVDANGNTQLATSNDEGLVSFDNIPFGDAYVTELTAPEGYKLDSTVHHYYVDGSSNNTNVLLEPTEALEENVVAFDLVIAKFADDESNPGSGVETPLAGVEFQIISNDTKDVVGSIVTDDDGFASTEGLWFGEGSRTDDISGALPYNIKGYTVREVESTIPEGFEHVDDWTISCEGMTDGATLRYIVDNHVLMTRLQIAKIDSETGQTVPLAGFSFQILDDEGNLVSMETWYPSYETLDTFVTDESGTVTLPETLAAGTYTIREVSAEAPYVIGADVTITIGDEGTQDGLAFITFADAQAMGIASIVKLCSHCAEDSDGAADTNCTLALEGAEFDVIAMEDIISPDGTIQAVEGQICDHVITDEHGYAETTKLPLGEGSATYAFVETVAPEGHALCTDPIEFTLAYEDGDTSLVHTSVTAYDEPTSITINKTVLGSDTPLQGATFALWQDDGADADSSIPDLNDALLTITTGEDGTATVEHLAAGSYCLAETSAPDGYLVNEEILRFSIASDGSVEGFPSGMIDVEDDYTKTAFSKRDITTDGEIEGAQLCIIDAEGTVLESWISTKEEHVITSLAPGTYTLVETMTPNVYDEAASVEFVVEETGEIQEVVMYDEPITIAGEIDKKQEIADPIAPNVTANGDGLNTAPTSISDEGLFDYSLDFRSQSSTWVDEFTVTDNLEFTSSGLAYLVGITCAQAYGDYDGLMNVWYLTNLSASSDSLDSSANATLSDGHTNPWLTHESTSEVLGDDGRAVDYGGWHLWAANVSTTDATYLAVNSLGLADGEYVTAIRFEYGRVEADFSTRTEGWDEEGLKDEHDDVYGADASHEETFSLEDGTVVNYAPAVIHVQVTENYDGTEELSNSAVVDLYRNGGGEDLEDHDEDRVIQTAKVTSTRDETTSLDQTGGGAAALMGVGCAIVAVSTGIAWHLRRRAEKRRGLRSNSYLRRR